MWYKGFVCLFFYGGNVLYKFGDVVIFVGTVGGGDKEEVYSVGYFVIFKLGL